MNMALEDGDLVLQFRPRPLGDLKLVGASIYISYHVR